MTLTDLGVEGRKGGVKFRGKEARVKRGSDSMVLFKQMGVVMTVDAVSCQPEWVVNMFTARV